MKTRLVTFVPALLIVLAAPMLEAQDDLAATGAAAGVVGLSADNANWDESPAGFLLTKKERKEWKEVTTDAQAKRFIDLFWARRNPDPAQPFNTFKAQFESRVRYADDNFGFDAKRGALTDRGRVLILMGPPDQAEHRAPTETVERMDDLATGTDEVRANAWMWMYDPGQLPKAFKAKGSRLLFVFYEEKAGTNNFTLDRSHREATMGMRAMSKAPDVHLLHPDLTEIPKPVSVPGGESASTSQLAWLESGAEPWTDRATVLTEAGLADAGHRPIWVHLELPAEAPELDLFVGRVSSPDGEVLSNFQTAATAIAAGESMAYHLTFPLREGDYTIEMVGAAGGEPQFGYRQQVQVPAMPSEGTWMSPMWVGLSADVEDDVLLGSAYCFGRLHLMPMTSPEVSREDELSYFGFVVRPGEAADGNAPLELKVTLKRDGKRLGRPLEMPLQGVMVADDVYVYANSIKLAALPENGEYGLVFEVEDPASEVSIEREVSINLTD